MGTVYRATQLSLNRSVALKVLSADLGEDRAFRERFRREGLLQAAIDHPHIVTVYDTGDSEHGLFLVMRMVRGPTLKDMVLGRELDPGRSLRLLAQVADALDTAHEVGLTHRDIKPQNILIGSRDHAYLADFGLTKAPDEAGRLTATGQFVGTIDYVSPEQIQGEPASERSDIYSFTGVLHECLVGAVPYPKPTEAAVVYAHISEPPPAPTATRPDLPAAIDGVIAKGMAKDPQDRYASAGELVREASRAFGEGVGEAPGPLATPEATGLRGADAEATPTGLGPTGTLDDLAAGLTAASPVHGPPAAAGTRPTGPPVAPSMPAPTAAPAPPAPAPPRRRSLSMPAVLAGLAVLAGAAGFLIGGSGSGSEAESEPERPANSVSAGRLDLAFPEGWERVREKPRVPGMRFSQPIVLSFGSRGARLNAGTVDGTGATLLPKPFLTRLARAPARDDRVRLGESEAYRYTGLEPRGADGPVTVYAAPTTAGVATIACVAPSRPEAGFAAECERVAATLALSGAQPLALGPRDEYARAAGAALRTLERSAAPQAKQLREAGSPEAQADAATDLSQAYLAAARTLSGAPAGPLERTAHARMVASLREVGGAYQRAARAAEDGDDGAYSSAGQDVRRGGTDLKRAQGELRKLGYSVG